MSSRTRRRLRVHITNSRSQPSLYRITRAHWQAACDRHEALAGLVDVSIGWDGPRNEAPLSRAVAAIGIPARRSHLAVRAPRLAWLHHTSAGVDSLLPLDWLPRGAVLTNNRGAHGAKAEQYLRMAYTMLHCRMPTIIGNQQKHRWQQIFSAGLPGRTALIIGMGDLGEAAARAARQLGLRVVGVSRSGRPVRAARRVHPVAELDALLPEADFVVLTVPLTAETALLLDRRRLARLKRGAGIINIARAGVIDMTALMQHLENGHLAGAMLDVVDPEPLPAAAPLWTTRNVVITPHISCDDATRYVDITLDLWFGNLARFLAGRRLRNRVDSRLGY